MCGKQDVCFPGLRIALILGGARLRRSLAEVVMDGSKVVEMSFFFRWVLEYPWLEVAGFREAPGCDAPPRRGAGSVKLSVFVRYLALPS